MSETASERDIPTDPLLSQATESSEDESSRAVSLTQRLGAELLAACWSGCLQNVHKALIAAAHLREHGEHEDTNIFNCVDVNGETPLSSAAVRGHVEIVQELLRAGADDQWIPPGSDMPIPMVRAAAAGHAAVVHQLRHHSPAIARHLLEASYDRGPFEGHNALSISALNGQFAVVAELLAHQPVADVHSGPYYGAPLLEAAARGYAPIVATVLHHGGDANCHVATGRRSAMQLAVEGEHWAVCALLAAYDAALDPLDTPTVLGDVLTFAITADLDEAVDQLLAHALTMPEMNLDACLPSGNTLMTVAVACNNLHAVRALLAHGASPSASDLQRNTPLLVAASLGHCATVRALLDHNADPNCAAGSPRAVPLMVALSTWMAGVQSVMASSAEMTRTLAPTGHLGYPLEHVTGSDSDDSEPPRSHSSTSSSQHTDDDLFSSCGSSTLRGSGSDFSPASSVDALEPLRHIFAPALPSHLDAGTRGAQPAPQHQPLGAGLADGAAAERALPVSTAAVGETRLGPCSLAPPGGDQCAHFDMRPVPPRAETWEPVSAGLTCSVECASAAGPQSLDAAAAAHSIETLAAVERNGEVSGLAMSSPRWCCHSDGSLAGGGPGGAGSGGAGSWWPLRLGQDLPRMCTDGERKGERRFSWASRRTSGTNRWLATWTEDSCKAVSGRTAAKPARRKRRGHFLRALRLPRLRLRNLVCCGCRTGACDLEDPPLLIGSVRQLYSTASLQATGSSAFAKQHSEAAQHSSHSICNAVFDSDSAASCGTAPSPCRLGQPRVVLVTMEGALHAAQFNSVEFVTAESEVPEAALLSAPSLSPTESALSEAVAAVAGVLEDTPTWFQTPVAPTPVASPPSRAGRAFNFAPSESPELPLSSSRHTLLHPHNALGALSADGSTSDGSTSDGSASGGAAAGSDSICLHSYGIVTSIAGAGLQREASVEPQTLRWEGQAAWGVAGGASCTSRGCSLAERADSLDRTSVDDYGDTLFQAGDGIALATMEEQVLADGAASPSPSEQPRRPRLRFRVDGEMGRIGCVRALLAATEGAYGLLDDVARQCLVTHGVVAEEEMDRMFGEAGTMGG